MDRQEAIENTLERNPNAVRPQIQTPTSTARRGGAAAGEAATLPPSRHGGGGAEAGYPTCAPPMPEPAAAAAVVAGQFAALAALAGLLQRRAAGGGGGGAARDFYLTYLCGVYAVAFGVALQQNGALLGAGGLLPWRQHHAGLLEQHGGSRLEAFRAHPSVLWLAELGPLAGAGDLPLHAVAALGLGLAAAQVLFGANGMAMLVLWALQLSLTKVGQSFYAFGWETQLAETGWLACFACPLWTTTRRAPGEEIPPLVRWGSAWLLFRIMLGAGLIKVRGDACWRDLTCMQYHYETQVGGGAPHELREVRQGRLTRKPDQAGTEPALPVVPRVARLVPRRGDGGEPPHRTRGAVAAAAAPRLPRRRRAAADRVPGHAHLQRQLELPELADGGPGAGAARRPLLRGGVRRADGTGTNGGGGRRCGRGRGEGIRSGGGSPGGGRGGGPRRGGATRRVFVNASAPVAPGWSRSARTC